MRFIRRSLMAASYVLVFLGSAQAQSVTIGSTTVWSGGNDCQNGNLLLAQIAKLSQAATIQSLSFYVTAASGNLILGIYDATGPSGGPGALKASTASFAPKTGWNTAKVVTPVSLAAGSYWLAYLPSSNALSFVKTNATGNCKYYSYNFGNLPSKFSTSPASCNPTTWSFYATLTTSSSGHLRRQRRMRLLERRKPYQRADRQPLHRRHGIDCQRQRPVVMELRRQRWRDHGDLLCDEGRFRAACERRVRQRERGNGKHRADREPLQRRHGIDCQRQRSVGVELRRQQWRQPPRRARISSPPPAPAATGSTGTTGSDPTSGVLPSYNDAYANWKNAGLQSVGGIPNRTTICATVNPLGGGQDDFTDIQNAINKCPAGEVVQLGAGAFTVHMADLPIQISTGIVLRGTGSCTGSSSPYCQTSITVADGALAYTGGKCGTSTSS